MMKKEVEITKNKSGNNSNTNYEKDSISNTSKLFGDAKKIKNVFKPFTKTGSPELDALLGGGFTPGWAVLGAISNLGKSSFALQLAANIVKSGTPVLFFSLEMPKEWIAAKLISRQVFENTVIKKGMPFEKAEESRELVMAKELLNKESVEILQKEGHWDNVKEAAKNVTTDYSELHIIDAKDNTDTKFDAETIRDYVTKYIENHDKKPFVIVDYLQIIPMRDDKSAPSDRLAIDHNIEVLSKIDKDITVLLISSISRTSYKDPVKLDSFKGSGTIEYSADVVLALDFSEAYTNPSFDINTEKARVPRKLQLMALKQRYNASGKDAVIKYDYYSAYDIFIRSVKEKTSNKESKSKQSNTSSGKSENTQTGKTNNFKFSYFEDCKDMIQAEKRYKKLLKKFHPDTEVKDEYIKDIYTQITQEINEQYAELKNKFNP